MSEKFDPYYKWLGIPPEEQPPHHYRLLGIRIFESDVDVIEGAADRQTIHLKGVQAGKQAVQSQVMLNEIAQARIVLLDPKRKRAYDQKLQLEMGEAPVRAPGNAQATSLPMAVPLGAAPNAGSPQAQQGAAKPVWQHPLLLAGVGVAALLAAGMLGVAVAVLLQSDSSDQQPVAQGGDTETDDGEAANPDEAADDTDNRGVEDDDQTPPARIEDNTPAPAQETPTPEKPLPAEAPAVDNPRPETNPAPANSTETPPAATPAPRSVASDNAPPGVADPPGSETRPAKPAEPERLAMPSEEQQAPVRSTIEEAFGLNETLSAAQQLAAAKDLHDAARKTTGNAVEKFVLLRMATEMAAAGGDAQLMLSLIDAVGAEFAIEIPKVQQTMLVRFAAATKSKAAMKSLMAATEAFYEQALVDNRHDAAMEVADAVYAAAQSGAGLEFRKPAYDRRKEIAELQQAWQEVVAARETLATNPDDPAAHLTLGSWHCFDQDDWNAGLPHLAKGGDAEIANLARQEIAPPDTPDRQVALGDGWYDLGEKTKGNRQKAMQTRAAYWYGKALPGLTSTVARLKIEKRLEKIDDSAKPPATAVAANEPAKPNPPAPPVPMPPPAPVAKPAPKPARPEPVAPARPKPNYMRIVVEVFLSHEDLERASQIEGKPPFETRIVTRLIREQARPQAIKFGTDPNNIGMSRYSNDLARLIREQDGYRGNFTFELYPKRNR